MSATLYLVFNPMLPCNKLVPEISDPGLVIVSESVYKLAQVRVGIPVQPLSRMTPSAVRLRINSLVSHWLGYAMAMTWSFLTADCKKIVVRTRWCNGGAEARDLGSRGSAANELARRL